MKFPYYEYNQPNRYPPSFSQLTLPSRSPPTLSYQLFPSVDLPLTILLKANTTISMPSSYAPGFNPPGGFSPEETKCGLSPVTKCGFTPETKTAKLAPPPFCSALWLQNYGLEMNRIEREEELAAHAIARAKETAALPPTKFEFDMTGMTERDLEFELKANAFGYCCLFCKRFHCPATEYQHIPSGYRKFFRAADHLFPKFCSAIRKKHKFLITRSDTRKSLASMYRAYMKPLPKRNHEVTFAGLPFCVHARIQKGYGAHCKCCNTTPCFFFKHLKKVMLQIEWMIKEEKGPMNSVRSHAKSLYSKIAELEEPPPKFMLAPDYIGTNPKCVIYHVDSVFKNGNFPLNPKTQKEAEAAAEELYNS